MAERLPVAALGRPAAARGAGARAGVRAAARADGRAARRARQAAARAHADRAEGAAPPARRHLRLRHARPGRGADDERPRRRLQRRRDPADRHRRSHVRGAGQPLRRRLHRRQHGAQGHGARSTSTTQRSLRHRPDRRPRDLRRQRRTARRSAPTVEACIRPERIVLHAQAPSSAATCCRPTVERRDLFRRPPAPAAATSATARRLPPSSCRCRPASCRSAGDAVWLEFPPDITRVYR